MGEETGDAMWMLGRRGRIVNDIYDEQLVFALVYYFV